MKNQRNSRGTESQVASPHYHITINITDSTVAQLNTAVEKVHTIESHLSAIANKGKPDLADALGEITQAIVDEEGWNPERRLHLIDNAENLSKLNVKLVRRIRWLELASLAALASGVALGLSVSSALSH